MFTLIEALRFRSLRYVHRSLAPFHVLVGPNASGKTTFLDVVGFMSDFVREGLDAAIQERTQNLQDLFWKRGGDSFELAVEVRFPEARRDRLPDPDFSLIRYELVVGIDPETKENCVVAERGLLKKAPRPEPATPRSLFPHAAKEPDTLLTPDKAAGKRVVLSKKPGKNVNYSSETYGESGKGWVIPFKLGPQRSALASLPDDERKFPVATWFKEFLGTGIQRLTLNSLLIRRASPPGQVRGFKPDGSNLPWVVHDLKQHHPNRARDWLEHVRTALPEIESIDTQERADDRHRYLTVTYQGGITVPSWVVSDGTLRLLALTLIAYLSAPASAYLIEEPENGIHPRAVETLLQSLSCVYDSQVLVATHSPIILSSVEASNVLCFAKGSDGATDIVRGDQHPNLRTWRGEENLGVLFAGGVLG